MLLFEGELVIRACRPASTSMRSNPKSVRLLTIVLFVFVALAGCRQSVPPRPVDSRDVGSPPTGAVGPGVDLNGDGIPDTEASPSEVSAVRKGIEMILRARRDAGDPDPAPEVLAWLSMQPYVGNAVADADHATITVLYRDGSKESLILKSFKGD